MRLTHQYHFLIIQKCLSNFYSLTTTASISTSTPNGNADISIVERCSGHGGTFGVLSPTHDLARKVGKPAARQVAKVDPSFVISSCPLASKHLSQITKEDIIKGNEKSQIKSGHPIELMAVSYGFLNKDEMSE